MKKLPAAIQNILDAITKELPKIFGDNLFGIYLYGSLISNTFDPDRSDIDCAVVIKKKLTRTEIEKIKLWYAALFSKNPFAQKIEMCFVLRDYLYTDGKTVSRTPQLWNGKFYLRKDSDGNSPIVWSTIREKGISLYGPKPKSFVPFVSIASMRTSQLTELKFIAQKSEQWMTIPANRIFIVITLCRILYTLRFSRIAPKKTALHWCVTVLPKKWHAVILGALDDLQKKKNEVALLKKSDVREFVSFVLRKCNR